MKRFILVFAFVAAALGTRAQAGYNYYQFGWEVGTSWERGYTNVPRQDNNFGFTGSLMYNYNPYVPIAVEVQKGSLSGGGLPPLDRYGRQFNNNFLAFYGHMDIQLGAFIDYGDSWILNIVKNFYGGSGAGFVFNNNKVQRTQRVAEYGPPSYVFYGKDKSVNIAVPLRLGYEFKIYDSYNQPGYAIDIGYIHNFVFGEGLDGYDDPPSIFKNNATNQYRQFTVSFKYFFGTTVSYNKLVKDYGF